MQHTILLVDDESDIVKLFQSYLECSGFRVLSANDALSAIEIARRHPVDALISDMRMPGMNGQELLECLRENRPRLPAITVSGYPKQFTMDLDDITQILGKPVSLSLLVGRLHGMLSRKNSQT